MFNLISIQPSRADARAATTIMPTKKASNISTGLPIINRAGLYTKIKGTAKAAIANRTAVNPMDQKLAPAIPAATKAPTATGGVIKAMLAK